MENLLKCDGRRFICMIENVVTSGIITVEGGMVYLCQDKKNGCACRDKKGYSYSWCVYDGSVTSLSSYNVTNFRLYPLTRQEVDAFKDWLVGDKLTDGL